MILPVSFSKKNAGVSTDEDKLALQHVQVQHQQSFFLYLFYVLGIPIAEIHCEERAQPN